MSEAYTTSVAYSGEVNWGAPRTINLDVFGVSEIQLPVGPDIWFGELGQRYLASIQFPLAAAGVVVAADAPEGIYYLRALGAYKVFGDGVLPLWSPYQRGWWNTSREGTPSRGGRLILNSNPDLVVRLPAAGFNEEGFETLEEAESAAAAASSRFWHPGGQILFELDDPYREESLGGLQISVTGGNVFGDKQGWRVVHSEAGHPAEIVGSGPQPTLRGLAEGFYQLEFWVHDPVTNRVVKQDFTIHVWAATPRGRTDSESRRRSAAEERDVERGQRYTLDLKDVLLSPQRYPVKPPMVRDANSPAIDRTVIEPKPRYSGQLSNRPEEPKQTRWKEPRKLSGDEEF